MALSPAIDKNILAALQIMFTQELQTNLVGDPVALKTLKQEDLQDDPTTTAPYLVYGPDQKQPITLIPPGLEHLYGSIEIGGPIKYLHPYEARFGIPLYNNRNGARTAAASLAKHIRNALIVHSDLSNLVSSGPLCSDDQSEYIEGQNWAMVQQMQYSIFGGENTFYAKGTINWVYPVAYMSPSQRGW